MNRRRRIYAAAAVLALCASSQGQELMLEPVASGFDTATSVCAPPGDTQRLFVTTNGGLIQIIRNGAVLPTPFLDLSPSMSSYEGILCMAFHPDYATNGRFFLVYNDTLEQSHLVEYLVSSDPDVADPNSSTQLLTPFQQPGHVHNWNCLKFGPDGMLYVGTGDGGGYHGFPADSGAAQDLSSTQGKILRLEIDAPAPYIPLDNPFVGLRVVAEEIWVYGLRQPWRFAFDALTGDMFIGDVGQTTSEELDFIPGGHPGDLNFGWACREGTVCTGITDCSCPDSSYVEPILEYNHGSGLCCIIGGEVYRGLAMPTLHGTYFYADLCSGRVWSLRYDGTNMTDHQERSLEFVTSDGSPLNTVYSFGTDSEGELLVIGNFPTAVYRVIPAPTCSTSNYCETSPNSVGVGALITNAGSTSFAMNDFQLDVNDLVPNQFALCYYGPDSIQDPFMDGYRCIGGHTQRLNPPTLASAAGYLRREIDLENQGIQNQITPGSTWHFQAWYRDPNGPGGSGSNLSDALTATFCP